LKQTDKRRGLATITEPLKGDIRRMKISYEKAKKHLGYEPTYMLEDGIKEMIQWISRH